MSKHRVVFLLMLAFTIAQPNRLLLAQTLRYTVVSNGKNTGSEVDTFTPDHHVDSTFEFNDRGRGPKIVGHYELGADGRPLRVDLTGVDYLKAPVDEHLLVDAGRSKWQSTAEKGEAAAGGFYVSLNGSPSELSFLVAALVKAKGPVS